MRIGIVSIIAVVMMLAMVSSASADLIVVVGTIQYNDGTTCPYGWDVWMVNEDSDYPEEPWPDPLGSHSFIVWDYKVSGEANSDDNHVTVNVTSPDGKWFDERVNVRLGDVYDPVSDNYIIDLVVEEQEQPTETFTKSLPLGWNLISLPLTPIDSSTGAVLGNDTIEYNAVKQYDATTKTFADATTMAPGTGYFVHVTTAGDWVYEGTAAADPTSTGLKAGLNMIGVLNCTKTVSDTMSSIAGNYRYVARWDAVEQKFEVYNPNAPAAFYGFTTMTAGEGYFVSAKTDCTLDVTCTG